MRRLAPPFLAACLIASLFSVAPGSAAATSPAKRLARACKKVARTSSEAHKRAAVRRAKRRATRCGRVTVRRRVIAPRSRPGSAPLVPGVPEPSRPVTPAGRPGPGSTPPAEAPGDTTAPLPPSNPYALQVVSGEFFLQLSKPEVRAGNVRVEFNNAYAEDPHDLNLVRPDGTGASYSFGALQSGQVEAKTLKLNAGTWRLFCALPQHAELGMSVKLRVAAG